jgi:hypothetical protein
VIHTLFNNCQARPHAQLYGAGAFYDLYQKGRQARMATDLRPGQHCCVATPTDNGDIEFGWYRFSHVRVMEMPDERGTFVRVFFGEWLGSEYLSRAEAIPSDPYACFFNVNGHFKRQVAIPPQGNCVAPAGVSRG